VLSRSRVAEILIRDGNHPKPVGVEPCGLLLHLVEMACVERSHVAVHRVVCASGKYLLDRTFADQQMLPFLGCQDDGHAPPRKVEGQLIDFLEAMLELYMFLHLDVIKHGNVEQVLQAGLKMTV
jgi:hypothetical protein